MSRQGEEEIARGAQEPGVHDPDRQGMKMGETEKLFREGAGEKRFAPGAGPGAADDVALGSCGDDVEHGREDVPARRKDLGNKFDTLLPALPFEVLDLALQKFGRDGAVPDVNQRQCPIGDMGGEPDGVPGDPVAVEGTVVSEVEHLPPGPAGTGGS
jgi:hypothetical protein